MYPETAYVLNDTRRYLESVAAVLDAEGKAFFASQARDKAKTLAVFLSGQVACCEYRAAADQVKQMLDAAHALRQALPATATGTNAGFQATTDPNAQAAFGFDFSDDD